MYMSTNPHSLIPIIRNIAKVGAESISGAASLYNCGKHKKTTICIKVNNTNALMVWGKINSNGRRTILSGKGKTRLFDLRAGTSLVLKNLQLSYGCVGGTTFQHPLEMKCKSGGNWLDKLIVPLYI